ncbi:MAG: hypothetical protein KatS3mg010_2069 [Acidimicrobiia bacterium]|nr:MAG: hypothetical protein KatS3mg010_2069 [Acidimicrobiia bacterium]
MWYLHDGGWGWFPMLLGMLAFWGVVAVFVVWAVRTITGPDDRVRGRSRALEILDERYARGEIDDDEYRRRRDQLTAGVRHD